MKSMTRVWNILPMLSLCDTPKSSSSIRIQITDAGISSLAARLPYMKIRKNCGFSRTRLANRGGPRITRGCARQCWLERLHITLSQDRALLVQKQIIFFLSLNIGGGDTTGKLMCSLGCGLWSLKSLSDTMGASYRWECPGRYHFHSAL
jgi:hypothetical protein